MCLMPSRLKLCGLLLVAMNPNAPPPCFCGFLLAFSLLPLLASSAVVCSPQCANVNLTYPFGAGLQCGYPGFQLSCGTPSAQWLLDVSSARNTPLLYAVNGIVPAGDGVHGSVTLSWGSARNDCVVLGSNNSGFNSTLFSGPSLSVFNMSDITYSEGDMYLLLQCENGYPKDDQYCSMFNQSCSEGVYMNASVAIKHCVSFAPKNRSNMQTELRQALQTYNCSYYTPLVNGTVTGPFFIGLELKWTLPTSLYSLCAKCEGSGGVCGYTNKSVSSTQAEFSNRTGYDFVCNCDDGTSTTTVCQGCEKFSCSSLKLALVIVLPITAASVALVLACLVRRRRLTSTRSIHGGSSHHFVTERGKSFAALFGAVNSREFSFKELEEGTESFSDDRLLGDGGFGAVYHGRLYDNHQVAVKRLYHDNFRRMEQFYNEIRILSSLQHPNLVRLYGYCCEDDKDLLLVFEYVRNGTLADHLHNPNAQALPWKIRLNIALETAGALSYLHNDVSPPIYHRDVKSTNILLEQDFQVKVADFGLSRLVPLEATHVSTLPQGTPGYLDPDYHHTYQLTDKSDVYSFGVVLMELISSLPAVDMTRSRGQINLASLAVSKIVSGAWQDLIDTRLTSDNEPEVKAMVRNVGELAFQCLNAEKENRPTIQEVVRELSTIRDSGLKEFISPFDGNKSFDMKESSRLIDKVTLSPTSVQSPFASSNTSSADSGTCLLPLEVSRYN